MREWSVSRPGQFLLAAGIDKRMGGPQRCFGRSGKEASTFPLLGIDPQLHGLADLA